MRRLILLLASLPFIVPIWASGKDPVDCPTSYRAIAQQRAIALGNGPRDQPFLGSRNPKIRRNSDGSYDIDIERSADGPAQHIHYSPVAPSDPSQGFRVARKNLQTGELEESFSRTPPVSFELIREENRRLRLKEEQRVNLLEQHLRFHGIPDSRMEECRRIVQAKHPAMAKDELDLLSASYAVATLPNAIQTLEAGAAYRGHSAETVRKLLTLEQQDSDTIATDIHQRYSDTIGALRMLRRHGFSDLADQISRPLLEKVPR